LSDSNLTSGQESVASSPLRFASPLRRLAAMLYDVLPLIAVVMVATAPFIPFLNGRVLLPSEVGVLAYVYWLWEIVVIVLFFGVFWTRKGRTLGMQAWRLRIETSEGQLPRWRDVVQRLAWATVPWLPAFVTMTIAEHVTARNTIMPIGAALLVLVLLNYCAAWWDSQRRAWHDRWLRTRIVMRDA